MPLSISASSPTTRDNAVYAAALLHALARDEAAGHRPRRLTEPGLPTWKRFHGRLTSDHFVQLLFEDAAAVEGFTTPFLPAAVSKTLRIDRLPHGLADTWLKEIAALDLAGPSADYILEQAKLLGAPTRFARSDLHVVQSHQKVLELPGTGGQLAHHLVSTQESVTLQDNLTVACGSWQELTLAGIIALDLRAPSTGFAELVEVRDLRDPEHPVRQQRFDFVVGLHPDKGGLFRAENQLDIWFAGARIVLV